MNVFWQPRIFGYARISTPDQNLDRQVEELKRAGVPTDRIFTEQESAAKPRPVFESILSTMREGDKLVVVALDRAFRNTLHALSVLEMLNIKKAHLHIINMAMDTSTSIGKAMFTHAAAFAEMERNVIAERRSHGIAAAKARGVYKGRPVKPVDPKKVGEIIRLFKKEISVRSIIKITGVTRTLVVRVLVENGLKKKINFEG